MSISTQDVAPIKDEVMLSGIESPPMSVEIHTSGGSSGSGGSKRNRRASRSALKPLGGVFACPAQRVTVTFDPDEADQGEAQLEKGTPEKIESSELKENERIRQPKSSNHVPVMDLKPVSQSIAPRARGITFAPVESTAEVKKSGRTPSRQVFVVNNNQYVKLEVIGRGGSSDVLKVLSNDSKIYALKKVNLARSLRFVDEEQQKSMLEGYLKEIDLLNRLKGTSRVVDLIESEYREKEGLLFLVLELGETDLDVLLRKEREVFRTTGLFDEGFVRYYWRQMLMAVRDCHDNGVVHADLKPSNFVLVKGELKLIDFGISESLANVDDTSIVRETQVGTINYMSPESLLGTGIVDSSTESPQQLLADRCGSKVGKKSDIWSLGAILYQMVYGHLPFDQAGRFIPQKVGAIINHKWKIPFPSSPQVDADLRSVLERCLERDPKRRLSLQQLLSSPFLTPGRTLNDMGHRYI